MGAEERAYGKLGEVIEEKKTIPPLTGGATPPTYTTTYKHDTFGRLFQLTYPDGEFPTYAYDAGGNLKITVGLKKGYRYPHLQFLAGGENTVTNLDCLANGCLTKEQGWAHFKSRRSGRRRRRCSLRKSYGYSSCRDTAMVSGNGCPDNI